MPRAVTHGTSALFVAATVALVSSGAAAEASVESPGGVALDWQVATGIEGCPSAAAVEEDVRQRLLSGPTRGLHTEPLRIVARVDRSKQSWTAELELTDAAGQTLGRRLVESSATTCETLASVAALSIALLVEAVPAPAPAPASAAPCPEPPPPRRVERPLVVRVHAGALFAAEVLPAFAVGSSLRVEVAPRFPISVLAGGHYLPEQDLVTSAASLHLALAFATLGGCASLPFDEHISMASCLEIAGGALNVAVSNAVPEAPGARSWFAALPSLRFLGRWGALSTALSGSLVIPFERRDLLLGDVTGSDVTSLYVLPPVGMFASIEIGIAAP